MRLFRALFILLLCVSVPALGTAAALGEAECLGEHSCHGVGHVAAAHEHAAHADSDSHDHHHHGKHACECACGVGACGLAFAQVPAAPSGLLVFDGSIHLPSWAGSIAASPPSPAPLRPPIS